MTSREDNGNKLLLKSVQEQMSRLLTQLQDLEEAREEVGDEYETIRADTVDQMQTFEGSLRRMMQGDMSLVDDLRIVQLAIQASIRKAFKSHEVIKMFAAKEHEALRERLARLKEDLRLGRMSAAAYNEAAGEILAALRQLGQQLTPEERSLLESLGGGQVFGETSDSLSVPSEVDVLSTVAGAVKRSNA